MSSLTALLAEREKAAGTGAAPVVDPYAELAKARRGSRSATTNNATATMRVSVSSIVNNHGKDRHDDARRRRDSAENVKKERRKSSLLQMGVANAAIREAASAVLVQEAAAATSGVTNPVQNLQALLTKAKERGMSAERLFEHFAPNGETAVTPTMFETALRKLGKNTFDMDEIELEHLMMTLDTNGNGSVELEEFMTFCLSIPSLPWRAERVRRLSNSESKDHLSVAARKISRRRSSLKAVPIGELVHQGPRFFWRSKENIDVAFHYNKDEGFITISTRSHERGYNYPAIFVNASMIPVTRIDAIARANSIGQFEAYTEEEKREAIERALSQLRVEYLQHRLKVPDGVNENSQDRPQSSGSTDTLVSSSTTDGSRESEVESSRDVKNPLSPAAREAREGLDPQQGQAAAGNINFDCTPESKSAVSRSDKRDAKGSEGRAISRGSAISGKTNEKNASVSFAMDKENGGITANGKNQQDPGEEGRRDGTDEDHCTKALEDDIILAEFQDVDRGVSGANDEHKEAVVKAISRIEVKARGANLTLKERAEDRASRRPFLACLSTDGPGTLLCERNIVLQTPHRFETSSRRRSSLADFNKASLEFDKLAKETERLSSVAESRTHALKASIDTMSAVTAAAARATAAITAASRESAGGGHEQRSTQDSSRRNNAEAGRAYRK